MAGEQHPFDLPQDPAAGVGDQETPQGAALPTEPPNELAQIKETVESLKPLSIFAEVLKDPAAQQRVINALTGAGAPPRDASAPQGPTLAEQEAKISARYAEQRKAAIANGDFDTAFALTEQAGAEIGELRSNARFQAAANPVVSMTARNTIDNWCATKRATSPYFVKLEPKFQAFVNQTPPDKLAELALNGGLIIALESAWNKMAAEAAESGYNRNFPVEQTRPTPPSYSMGTAGGNPPDRERVEDADKDDDEFQKLAEKAGVQFSVDPKTGAILGEMK